MPDNVTNERRQMAALFGAEVIDSPGALGSNGAIALAKHLVSKDERFVMPYQYGNPANPLAHYETTGPEILADCPEIDVFVAGLGTSGTLMGVSRYLHEHKPGVRIVAAEPLPGELVQGLRSLEEGFIPEILDPSLIDAKYLVSNRDAIAALRDLVFKEGIFAGPSCGAVLVAAARVAQEMTAGTIVALLPDGGWKYLSAGHVLGRPRRHGGGARGRRQLVVSEAHPGPVSAALPGAIRDAIVAHARAEYPNEAAGLVIGDGYAAAGGRALRFEATRNKAASPLRYEIDPDDLYRLTIATDDADEVFWAIVHSHTHTPAVPSPTDVGLAFYPDALYVLVSLSDDEAAPDTDAPSVRAWRIVDGVVFEVPLT